MSDYLFIAVDLVSARARGISVIGVAFVLRLLVE